MRRNKRTMFYNRVISLLLVVVLTVNIMPLANFTKAAETEENCRYSVLVLDSSPSMSNESMEQMKEAAHRFTSQVIAANGQNYVAVIAYSKNAEVMCGFSNNLDALKGAINNIDHIRRDGTNTYAGLLRAKEILSSEKIPATAIKNLILMTDGIPNQDPKTKDGPYTIEDCSYRELINNLDYTYLYANSVYNLSKDLKKEVNIYTLGFFQDFDSFYPHNTLDFAVRCLEDVQSRGYY